MSSFSKTTSCALMVLVLILSVVFGGLAGGISYRWISGDQNVKLTNGFFNPKEIFRMFIDLLGITYRLKIKKHYLNNITTNLYDENIGAI